MDFVGVMREAQNIQLSHQNISKDRLTAVIAALIEVQPDKDQALFAEYNIHPFSLPDDWVFEPCSNHYDTVGLTDLSYVHCVKSCKLQGDICIDSGPKVLLQNKLARSRAKLRELNHVLGKQREWNLAPWTAGCTHHLVYRD